MSECALFAIQEAIFSIYIEKNNEYNNTRTERDLFS